MEPIPAATIILVRGDADGGGLVEVLLLRRSRQSSFMANAFVFPGGRVEAGESFEAAAIRETLEEANVKMPPGVLHPWARWITPVVEPKRFDARFFVAELPDGEVARFDEKEVVEQLWITPSAALERHRTSDFRLPPPQLRTLWELARCGVREPDRGTPSAEGARPSGRATVATTMEAIVAESQRRAAAMEPIMPHFVQVGDAPALLLPWDRDYPGGWPSGHPLAIGPSRFVLEGMSWRME